jgi:hypothetical protein
MGPEGEKNGIRGGRRESERTCAFRNHCSLSSPPLVFASTHSCPLNASTSKHLKSLVAISSTVSFGERMARCWMSFEARVRSDKVVVRRDWVWGELGRGEEEMVVVEVRARVRS